MRLQALVRGHNVRKQAQMTMRCMQALVRVQARVRARRLEITHEKLHKKVEEEERVVAQTKARDNRNQSIEKIKESNLRRHDAEMKRERALAYAFAYQVGICIIYFMYALPFIDLDCFFITGDHLI